MCISVDLPEPDGPMTATRSPRRDVEGDAAERVDRRVARAVAAGEVARLPRSARAVGRCDGSVRRGWVRAKLRSSVLLSGGSSTDGWPAPPRRIGRGARSASSPGMICSRPEGSTTPRGRRGDHCAADAVLDRFASARLARRSSLAFAGRGRVVEAGATGGTDPRRRCSSSADRCPSPWRAAATRSGRRRRRVAVSRLRADRPERSIASLTMPFVAALAAAVSLGLIADPGARSPGWARGDRGRSRRRSSRAAATRTSSGRR